MLKLTGVYFLRKVAATRLIILSLMVSVINPPSHHDAPWKFFVLNEAH